MITALIILGLAIASGILGRMGGSEKYDTKYRDVGCSLLAVVACILLFGFSSSHWYIYLIIFGLHWGAFSTYWDFMFKDKDNLWFSGFVVGLCIAPMLFINLSLWWVVVARALTLAVAWGLLNKYLPSYVFKLRRDVAEEFLRYSISL